MLYYETINIAKIQVFHLYLYYYSLIIFFFHLVESNRENREHKLYYFVLYLFVKYKI